LPVTSVRLSDDLFELLEALAEAEGQSLSDEIRTAVEHFLQYKATDSDAREQLRRAVQQRHERLATMLHRMDQINSKTNGRKKTNASGKRSDT
jgi:predicted transcriptional regulator